MVRDLHRTWIARGSLARLIEVTEPERMLTLHPLVVGVSDIRLDATGVTWTIDERVPFMWFSIHNRYTARREVRGNNQIVMEAWSRPNVHLLHTLDITEIADGVQVEHVVRVDAPWIIFSFVAATAEKAHDGWIERVRACVEES